MGGRNYRGFFQLWILHLLELTKSLCVTATFLHFNMKYLTRSCSILIFGITRFAPADSLSVMTLTDGKKERRGKKKKTLLETSVA